MWHTDAKAEQNHAYATPHVQGFTVCSFPAVHSFLLSLGLVAGVHSITIRWNPAMRRSLREGDSLGRELSTQAWNFPSKIPLLDELVRANRLKSANTTRGKRRKDFRLLLLVSQNLPVFSAKIIPNLPSRIGVITVVKLIYFIYYILQLLLHIYIKIRGFSTKFGENSTCKICRHDITL